MKHALGEFIPYSSEHVIALGNEINDTVPVNPERVAREGLTGEARTLGATADAQWGDILTRPEESFNRVVMLNLVNGGVPHWID